MKSILEAGNLKNKRVLVRVDWNVPFDNSSGQATVADDFRIRESMLTIENLLSRGAKVILATHLEAGISVEPLKKFLPSEVELLENLRNDPREVANDESFAKELASRADIFVNEAFSVCHRGHASIVSVPKLLPSYAGLHLEKEVKELSKAFNPEPPFLLIIGGAKFETKLSLIKKFIEIADEIFVGGALAHNFFKEQGADIKNSLVSDGNFNLERLLETKKIILPKDLVWLGDKIVDAGPETLNDLKMRLEKAKLVIWNGPLGNFEIGYGVATRELAKLITNSKANSIIGGGDTLAAIKNENLLDKFSFVSTGGGAMLDFLANGTLPGIEALN